VQWLGGDSEAAKSTADEAVSVLEGLGVSPELAYAYSSQAQLKMLASRHEEAVELADKAIAVAQELGDDLIAAHAMNNRASALLNLQIATTPEENPDLGPLEDVVTFVEGIGFWDEVARGMVNLAWAGLGILDLALAEKHARRAIEVCDEHELPAFRHYAIGTLADVKRLRGEWHEAEDLVRELLSQSQMWATSEILCRVVLGSILVRRGDPEADEQLARAWELARPTGEPQRTIPVSLARAELAWLSDRNDEERQILKDEIDRVRDLNPAWMWSDLVFRAQRMGLDNVDTTAVRDPYKTAISAEVETASTMFERFGLPYETALTLLGGNASQAARGISLLDGLGATAVAAKARLELRARGITSIPRRPRTTGRPGTSGLTERQLEVMNLIAEGLTNPEIADRLFVSPRTVDHHVSAILSKLGVSTRQEAARAFSA
jgi:ATP/maltotriose-dependent transcriptional regulator MalT